MTKKEIIQKAEIFVRACLAKEGTGHDWWHIVRVRNNAKLICRTEKADRFIVELALLLHDVGDRKVLQKAEDDYSIAENFLLAQNLDSKSIQKVMFIIRNMSFSKTLDRRQFGASKEFEIVQDADRLDAMGAIGIARVFAFGGSRSRPLYDPTRKVQDIHKVKDYKKMESTSFHHFFEKLLLLKDLMNTKTARKIAEKRHTYMEKYTKQFLFEWNAKA